jgi:hypothetical protein
VLGTFMLIRRVGHLRKGTSHIHHHGAPEPILVENILTSGILEIIQTADGERMRYLSKAANATLQLQVMINRPGINEILPLVQNPKNLLEYKSVEAPNEPHEFSAEFEIKSEGKREIVLFSMKEPEGHDHDHSGMDDDAHAKAHAATIPDYAKRGGSNFSVRSCGWYDPVSGLDHGYAAGPIDWPICFRSTCGGGVQFRFGNNTCGHRSHSRRRYKPTSRKKSVSMDFFSGTDIELGRSYFIGPRSVVVCSLKIEPIAASF